MNNSVSNIFSINGNSNTGNCFPLAANDNLPPQSLNASSSQQANEIVSQSSNMIPMPQISAAQTPFNMNNPMYHQSNIASIHTPQSSLNQAPLDLAAYLQQFQSAHASSWSPNLMNGSNNPPLIQDSPSAAGMVVQPTLAAETHQQLMSSITSNPLLLQSYMTLLRQQQEQQQQQQLYYHAAYRHYLQQQQQQQQQYFQQAFYQHQLLQQQHQQQQMLIFLRQQQLQQQTHQSLPQSLLSPLHTPLIQQQQQNKMMMPSERKLSADNVNSFNVVPSSSHPVDVILDAECMIHDFITGDRKKNNHGNTGTKEPSLISEGVRTPIINIIPPQQPQQRMNAATTTSAAVVEAANTQQQPIITANSVQQVVVSAAAAASISSIAVQAKLLLAAPTTHTSATSMLVNTLPSSSLSTAAAAALVAPGSHHDDDDSVEYVPDHDTSSVINPEVATAEEKEEELLLHSDRNKTQSSSLTTMNSSSSKKKKEEMIFDDRESTTQGAASSLGTSLGTSLGASLGTSLGDGMKISYHAWDGMLIDQLRIVDDSSSSMIPPPVVVVEILSLQEWMSFFQAKPLLTEYEYMMMHNLTTNPAQMEAAIYQLIQHALQQQKKHDLYYKQFFGWGYLKEQLAIGRASMLCTVFWTTMVIYLYHHPQYQSYKIPSITMFQAQYIDSTHPLFTNLDELELHRLYLFTNFLLITLYMIPAYRNEVLFLKMISCIERSGRKYQISTSGQMSGTTRRRILYRKLSGIVPHSSSTGGTGGTSGTGGSSTGGGATSNTTVSTVEGGVGVMDGLEGQVVAEGGGVNSNKRRRVSSLPPKISHPALLHGLPEIHHGIQQQAVSSFTAATASVPAYGSSTNIPPPGPTTTTTTTTTMMQQASVGRSSVTGNPRGRPRKKDIILSSASFHYSSFPSPPTTHIQQIQPIQQVQTMQPIQVVQQQLPQPQQQESSSTAMPTQSSSSPAVVATTVVPPDERTSE